MYSDMHLLNLPGIDSSKITDAGVPHMLEDLQLFELVATKMIVAIGGDFSTSQEKMFTGDQCCRNCTDILHDTSKSWIFTGMILKDNYY